MSDIPWHLGDLRSYAAAHEAARQKLDEASGLINEAYELLRPVHSNCARINSLCDSAQGVLDVFESIVTERERYATTALAGRREQVAHPELVGFEHS